MLPGGVAVLAGGVAGDPGVEVWPEVVVLPGMVLCPVPLALPAGAAPPAGAVCATAQLAQHRTIERSVNFFVVIRRTSGLKILKYGDDVARSCSKLGW